MAQQYRIKRRTHSQALTANNVITLDLPRGYDLETIFFHVTAAVAVTTAGTAVRAYAPTQLIKRVELIADGKNTIASVPGWWLVKNLARDQYGLMTPPTAATVATYNVEMLGSIDQCLVDGIRPKDSNLRTAGMSLLQLRITTGAPADLFTGSAAGSFSSFNVDISTVETIELPDAKTGQITTPLYLQKRSYQDISLPSSNANQQVILPIGNALRGVTLLATINGEPSNAVVNNIQLASGVDVRVNITGRGCQLINSLDNTNLGILSNSTTAQSSTQLPTGLYNIDLMRNGPRDVQVTNAWDLTKASEAKIVLDVNGGAGYALTVVTTEFIH